MILKSEAREVGETVNSSMRLLALSAIVSVSFVASLAMILMICACCRRPKSRQAAPNDELVSSNTIPPLSDTTLEPIAEEK